MSTLYHPGQDALPALPSRVLSFYRWLWRWFHQTGDVHPSTGYYARKQHVCERTVYRWVRQLREAGYIQVETIEGVERRVVPLVEPPKRVPKLARRGNVARGSSGVVSGVIPYSNSDADNYETTNVAPPVAAVEVVSAGADEVTDAVSAGADEVTALCNEGVPIGVAVNLLRSHGGDAVVIALRAYRRAREVRNPVGWLVRAVQRGYQTAAPEAAVGAERARRVWVPADRRPVAVNGLTGRAAFESLRSKLSVAGRVS